MHLEIDYRRNTWKLQTGDISHPQVFLNTEDAQIGPIWRKNNGKWFVVCVQLRIHINIAFTLMKWIEMVRIIKKRIFNQIQWIDMFVINWNRKCNTQNSQSICWTLNNIQTDGYCTKCVRVQSSLFLCRFRFFQNRKKLFSYIFTLELPLTVINLSMCVTFRLDLIRYQCIRSQCTVLEKHKHSLNWFGHGIRK